MKNIYLIGFMGAGKSTIARKLSEQTGRKLMDTDRLITKQAGKSISRIFAEEGEAFFRRTETECLRKLAQKGGLIVSCGGGVVLNPENVRIMQKSGEVVLLESTPEVILERVSRNNRRPLLEGKKNIGDIRAMMAERLPAYKAAATLRVRSDNRKPHQIAHQIIRLTNGD